MFKTAALNKKKKIQREIEREEEDSLSLPREEGWMRRGGWLGRLDDLVNACMHTGVYVCVCFVAGCVWELFVKALCVCICGRSAMRGCVFNVCVHVCAY